jgi:hypothetical protein
MISKDTARQLLSKSKEKPDWFIKNMLGAELWQKQIDIINSVKDKRYTTVRACHGPGKTFLSGNTVLWFLYTHKPSKVITTAPTGRQVYSLLWSEIREAHGRGSKIRPLGGDPLKTRLELKPGWYAEGFATSEFNIERVTGYHSDNILIIVDEASGVPDPIFDALEGLMSSGNAHMLLVGNPTRAEGRFRESFTNDLYAKFKISAFDTPNFVYFGITREDILTGAWQEKVGDKKMPRPYLVTPQWVAERFQTWGSESVLVKIKIDADFPSSDQTDKVIPIADLDECRDLYFAQDEMYSEIEVGVDIARYGTDESVLAFRAGRQPLYERVLYHKSTMAVVGAIREEISFLGPHRVSKIKLDVIGLGAGPVDRLLELQEEGEFPQHIEIIGVNVAMASKDLKTKELKKDRLRFVTLRDNLWWQFRERVQKREISTKNISSEGLKELSAPEYTMTSKGQTKIESKEDLRKADRLGKSPDRGDAWLLAFGNVVPEKRNKRAKVRVRGRR